MTADEYRLLEIINDRCPFPIGWLVNRGAWNQPFLATGNYYRWYTKAAPLFSPKGHCCIQDPGLRIWSRLLQCKSIQRSFHLKLQCIRNRVKISWEKIHLKLTFVLDLILEHFCFLTFDVVEPLGWSKSNLVTSESWWSFSMFHIFDYTILYMIIIYSAIYL